MNTRPTIALISEEIRAKKQSLKQVVDYITDAVCVRAKAGKNYGMILVPEGIVEFIGEVGEVISEINIILGDDKIA